MKINELKQRSKDELKRMTQEHKEKLRLLRFDLVSGKVKNVQEIRKNRKLIAQILTILKNHKEN